MNEFISELKTILEKYQAEIFWGCHECSDLHGVTGEFIGIAQKNGGQILKINGNYLTANELKRGEK